MIKTVLIDIDNTLLDFDAGTKLAIKTLFPKYCIPYSDGVLKTFASENAKLWDKIEKGELTKDELRRIRWNTIFRVLGVECDGEKFEKDYEDIVANTAVPIDGSEELLKYLKQNFSVYAVTNGFVKLQKKRLALCSFDKYFDGLFISEEIGANKPSKEFFDAVFKALSFPEKESVILIGDSLSADISGGNAYGIKTVLFENKPAGKNADTIPTFTVRSLREIEKLLDGLAC